ncbi:MAG: hypothetical protein HOV80_17075 [Polyangiaceae bacterium]|nr:hypothetical protein [Polyangiaceae bacterium]
MISRVLTSLSVVVLCSTACASSSGEGAGPAVDVAVTPQAASSSSSAPASNVEAQGAGGPTILERLLGGDPRIRECNQLIEAVNASKIGDSVDLEPKKLIAESQEAIRLRDQIGKLRFTDAKVVTLVKEYRESLTDYAAMMKQASEVDQNDVDGLMKLVQKAGEVATRNTELTAKINEHCAS